MNNRPVGEMGQTIPVLLNYAWVFVSHRYFNVFLWGIAHLLYGGPVDTTSGAITTPKKQATILHQKHEHNLWSKAKWRPSIVTLQLT
jgi:hypothetical protein